MSKLILKPTATAQLQSLVQEGAANCNHRLDEETESYLVFILMRTLKNQGLLRHVIAMDYLSSMAGDQDAPGLRNVGDYCLIFAGLFPKIARRRLVRISYFVNIGQSAYMQLSMHPDEQALSILYQKMAHSFVVSMDILQSLRGADGLTLAEEMDLWNDCRSKRAYSRLCISGSIPGLKSESVH